MTAEPRDLAATPLLQHALEQLRLEGAIFFRTEAGGEPLRGRLKSLPSPEDRKRIGEDIKTVGALELAAEPNRAGAFLYRQEEPDGLTAWIHQEDAEDTGRGFGAG